MIVGLSGKTCAGKDALLPFFTARGFTVVDADKIGHLALDANQQAVLDRFGTTDRKALGPLVFSDPGALAALEAIVHPWIAAEVRRQVALVPGPVVINAALLHVQDLYRLCDVVVWVQAPLLSRILRARARDGWGWMRIFRRIWAQRKLGPQVFPQDVDILRVDNQGPIRQAQTMLETRFTGSAFPQKEDTHEKQ